MGNVQTTSLLSAFATIKSLSEVKKYGSPYQILAEFVRYIIADKSLHSFNSAEIKRHLNENFGFVIPESVIKTTLRKLDSVSLKNGIYTVHSSREEIDPLFKEKIDSADEISQNLINSLTDYIKGKTGRADVRKGILTRELICFLVDDQQSKSDEYTNYISEFVLKNEKNEKIQTELIQIREGSILYIGLNYNIGETGSITKPLTLYLGTEILFDLVGYNGEIHKQLADDFYSLVRSANGKNGKKIILKYFVDTEKEINDFFYVAGAVVEGRLPQYIDKPAMIAITNGCSTVSDVLIRKADFYHNINYGYGIMKDSIETYYDESHFESNLESFDYIDDEDKKKKRELGIKFVSNINKLRDGKHYSNDIDSEYLMVTNTKATLLISQEQIDKIKEDSAEESISNFAVSLDRITSLLWYKLGKGFGENEYPSNVNAVLRARVILSSNIAKNAEKTFSDAKRQYKSGNITDEQLAARILTLKNKHKLPEELDAENIDGILDFSSSFLSRFEEKVKEDRKAIKERDDLIKSINSESANKDLTISRQREIICNQNVKLTERDDRLATQKQLIDQQTIELEEYHRKEDEARRKKQKGKNVVLFVSNIIWKIALIVVLLICIVYIFNRYCTGISASLGNALGAVGLIISAVTLIRNEYKKYFRGK